MDFSFAVAVIVALFPIVNPIGNVSFFVTLTEGYTRREKRAVIKKVVVVATVVLSMFALIGNIFFEMFSITIPAFRIAGGLLLLTIAFAMLQGRHPKTKVTDKDKEEALAREAVGIVPLGIPMFAGPGAITTVMIYMSEATKEGLDLFLIALVFLAIGISMTLAYVMLSYSERIFRRIGRMGALAFSRIMGLVLAAMAVQFLMDGIINFIRESGIL
jgi:multiple antibiotic resistance protein